jgi:hypothetical protein
MQTTSRPRLENQFLKDSKSYAAENVPFARQRQDKTDYEIAYLSGAKQALQYLEDFVLRLEKTIPLEKCSEFERGQLDGARWAFDAMRTLHGLD